MAAVVAEDDSFVAERRRRPQVAQGQVARFREVGELIGQRTDTERHESVGSGCFLSVARESHLKAKERVSMPPDAYPLRDISHSQEAKASGRLLLPVSVSDTSLGTCSLHLAGHVVLRRALGTV